MINELLFYVPVQPSPRLVWMNKYGVKTFKTEPPPEQGEESPETGEEIHDWYAGVGTMDCKGGRTEQEAIQRWALAHGVPLWNEEGFKPTER